MAAINLQANELTDRYFDLKTLAQYSSIGIKSLRSYLKDADHPLPCFRLEGKVLVRKSEFDTWIERFRPENRNLNKLVDEIVSEVRGK